MFDVEVVGCGCMEVGYRELVLSVLMEDVVEYGLGCYSRWCTCGGVCDICCWR